jgi:hypothetical protein
MGNKYKELVELNTDNNWEEEIEDIEILNEKILGAVLRIFINRANITIVINKKEIRFRLSSLKGIFYVESRLDMEKIMKQK